MNKIMFQPSLNAIEIKVNLITKGLVGKIIYSSPSFISGDLHPEAP